MKRFVQFSGRVIVAHVVTYVGVGMLTDLVLTRQFFEPEGVAAQVLRTPADPQLWSHVTRWMLPAQVLRGLLIAAVLFPFVPTLLAWSYARRVAALAGLYVVLGQWASYRRRIGDDRRMADLEAGVHDASHRMGSDGRGARSRDCSRRLAWEVDEVRRSRSYDTHRSAGGSRPGRATRVRVRRPCPSAS